MLHDPELHYLDNAATTIVAPEVADVIDKAMREHWANPSSLYAPGARSEEALNAARAAVARTLGCKSKELYFTSCGSEGNNLALLGAAQTRIWRTLWKIVTKEASIVVSGFEHPSVQRPLERLAAQGYNVTVVKPQADGTLDINKMLDAVDKNTILVACMMVNNELRFSDPGVGSTFDINSRTARNPGVAEASARKRSRTGKQQEVHVAARMGSVQLLTRTDRSMSSSNRGRRATIGR